MDRLPLGASGLSVTRIGLGLAALGRPAYITAGRDADLGSDRSVAAMRQRAHNVLDAAYDSGIRYFDAARSYGLAEEFLASWMDERQLPADAITIGSKWGYTYTGGWRLDAQAHEVKDLSARALARQIAESRALLGNRLGLYQIHSATIESGVLDDHKVLESLLHLRSEGLVIGLTTSGSRQAEAIERALSAQVDGVNLFQCVQTTWNLFERSAERALANAHAAGWGVILKEVLANGRLTDRNDALEVQPLRDIAASIGASLDALAFAAALANSWAHVVLSGAVGVEQLESNVRGLSLRVDLDALPAAAVPADEYWSARSRLPWE